ncbi:MAG: hypothetical protein A2946_02030 [Candidatus Liptonbacteria bacterium RIFCSPLOWO2_01_FULL_53_13]|uniref:Glycosyl transferase family 1 domain-containing protein n=1 Tax=Candidatus Liptonbacteria bacterium RIFCSPLOWO2_01_FULL_53_13 TaxID=1798651 RepID=A0A1G2CJV2_9BACT|nr:MAG: hypothetical protein A2946_02030 [Candidatus Liptonbacteria bacterium RIFCSPLOWO2_01_FULL_53_13]
MKIAFVHLNLAVESGDPRMFYCIAQGIKKQGHDVTVYTARFDPACFPDLHRELNIVVAKPFAAPGAAKRGKSFWDAVNARVARNRFQDEGVEAVRKVLPPDIDVLVCQNDRSYKLGNYYKQAHPRARMVWIMNNAPFYSERKRNFLMTFASMLNAAFEKWQVRRSLSGIDLIVVHDEERGKLARSLGKQTALLPIPVDFKSFYQPVKERASGDRHLTLLGIGALSPTRKFEDIISAGAILRDKGHDVRVILVCKDVQQDIGYKTTLLNLAKTTRMENRIDFHFDGASESELRALQKTADFFVFPNHFNIWSMASFESMAAGLPLLVSRVTSVAEALRDGEEALFFDPGNAEQIADSAHALVSDPARYARVAEAGQKFVKTKLDWGTYIKNFLKAIEDKNKPA